MNGGEGGGEQKDWKASQQEEMEAENALNLFGLTENLFLSSSQENENTVLPRTPSVSSKTIQIDPSDSRDLNMEDDDKDDGI